jgi:hypothetical protein
MKVISINGSRFALPAGMNAKDVQALAGLLVTLVPVNQEYNYDSSEYMHYPSSSGNEVRIDDAVELMTKAEAQKQHTESYERYKVKRDSEKAT